MTTTSHTSDAPRRDIQALRGWAVLLVLLFHAGVPGVQSGFLGVDIFFVISGFLITGLIASRIVAGTFSAREFFTRRFRRLLPAAYVTYLAVAVAAPFLLSSSELKDLSNDLLGAVTFSGNIVLWVDDADALHAEYAAKGVTIARAVCDQPYGCRDFDIEDCNGYRLCLGQDLNA